MAIINDKSLANDVCRTILAAAQVEHLWTAEGPVGSIDHLTNHLTRAERAMVCFARAVWAGKSGLDVGDLVDELDADHLVVLGTLLVAVAYGEEGIRDWLDVQNDRGRGERPTAVH